MQNKAEQNKNAQLIVAIVVLIIYFFLFVAPCMPKNENSTFRGPAAYYYSATIIPYLAFLIYFLSVLKKIKYIRCILFSICTFILYFGLVFVIPGGGAAMWFVIFTLLPFLGILLAVFLTSLSFDIMDRNPDNANIQRPAISQTVTYARKSQDNRIINYTKNIEVPVEIKICPFCGEVIPKNADGCIRGCEAANKDILKYINQINLSDELKKFNWGACLLSWIWGIGNNVPIAVLGIVLFFASLIPGIGGFAFIFFIWLGKKGNELAWNAGKYTNIRKFTAIQQKWAVWGFISMVVVSFLSIILFFMSFGRHHRF